jgi:uncharacterized protein (UPF0264 family)
VLISPVSKAEAKIAWACGTDIIDIRNIAEGSLGASFPWVIKGVIESVPDKNVVFSATLGDLPCKPGFTRRLSCLTSPLPPLTSLVVKHPQVTVTSH